jgi:hypothetical protein
VSKAYFSHCEQAACAETSRFKTTAAYWIARIDCMRA